MFDYWFTILRFDYLPFCYGAALLAIGSISFLFSKNFVVSNDSNSVSGLSVNQHIGNEVFAQPNYLPWIYFSMCMLSYGFAKWLNIFDYGESVPAIIIFSGVLLNITALLLMWIFALKSSEYHGIPMCCGRNYIIAVSIITVAAFFFNTKIGFFCCIIAPVVPLVLQLHTIWMRIGHSFPEKLVYYRIIDFISKLMVFDAKTSEVLTLV